MGFNSAFKDLKSVRVASSQFFSVSVVTIPSYIGQAMETARLMEPKKNEPIFCA